MYTIVEPYKDTPTQDSLAGRVPFFHIENEDREIVHVAVTRQECEKWIELQN